MDPGYFNYGELTPANVPGIYPYEYPEQYMFDYDALNPVGHLHYGGVSYGYNPAIFEPSPAGNMANMYQARACGPMVYATHSLPYDPQYSSVLPTLFQRGLSLEESTPRSYHFQGPGGIALQPGCSTNEISANQSDIHCQSFYNNGGCQISTHSYNLPHSPANAKSVSLRPNMVDGYLSPDYSMNGRTWSRVDQRITPGMYPGASSDGFGAPMPNSRLQHYFPRINDSVPGSSNQQTKSGQAPWSKPTRSNNKFELPVKSGFQKASHPKNHAPSSRGVPKTSAPHQVWQEKKKKKKTQPSAILTEPHTELTEPVYHITWNGIDEEYEHLEQKCPLCNKDLSYIHSEEDDSDYYDDLEPPKVPDVAVLPCGHAFHSDCLQLYTPEDQSIDPPCFVCFSSAS